MALTATEIVALSAWHRVAADLTGRWCFHATEITSQSRALVQKY